jgi:hypothetical protein
MIGNDLRAQVSHVARVDNDLGNNVPPLLLAQQA